MGGREPTLVEVEMIGEWRSYPCWFNYSDDSPRVNLPYHLISKHHGVTTGLLSEIEAWDKQFQDIWDPADPASADFPSEEVERQWINHGRQLAHRLAKELGPDVRVTYRHAKEVIQPGTASEEQDDD